MKKKFKIITLLLGVTLAFALGITASAETSDMVEVGNDTQMCVDVGGEYSECAEKSDAFFEGNTENGENVGNPSQTAEASETEEENMFSEVYEALKDNADKIFATLSFIGTLIVGYAYRKGLIPMLADATARFGSYLEGVKKENDKRCVQSEERLAKVSEGVGLVENSLRESEALLKSLDERLSSYGDIVRDHEKMRILFSAQIDLLYSIFMSSSLPQYQKDEIGEKISKMKEELKIYEGNEE